MTRDYAARLLAATPLFFLNMLFYYFIRCDDGEKRASVGLAVSNLLDVGLSFVFVWASAWGSTARCTPPLREWLWRI